VLARELTIEQIKAVRAQVETPLEYFIHGALCVAFSGQCYISHADNGRSANRGDCSQACRLPYTLSDGQGRVVAFEKHLLSMKDNDQSRNLEALVDAGIRSFKIEGRYKDMGYVKNITAHYRLLLDEIMERRPELARASSGRTNILFTPDVDKNFHRGHTDYFAQGRQETIGAFDSPKYVGVELGTVTRIGGDNFDLVTNGHGQWRRPELHAQARHGRHPGEYGAEAGRRCGRPALARVPERAGVQPGRPEGRHRGQPQPRPPVGIGADQEIVGAARGGRPAAVGNAGGLRLTHDRRRRHRQPRRRRAGPAAGPAGGTAEAGLRTSLGKLGNTMFEARSIALQLSQPWFVPSSAINALRRDAIAAHEAARLASWQRPERAAAAEPPAVYPEAQLSYLANVYNEKARAFYHKHGVQLIAAAYESHEEPGEVSLMITKHCLRFSFNLCPKQAKGVQGVQGQVRAEPMTLVSGDERYTLKFDCKPCEMHIIGAMKPHILNSPPPSAIPVQPAGPSTARARAPERAALIDSPRISRQSWYGRLMVSDTLPLRRRSPPSGCSCRCRRTAACPRGRS
jgi:hypothetical protein